LIDPLCAKDLRGAWRSLRFVKHFLPIGKNDLRKTATKCTTTLSRLQEEFRDADEWRQKGKESSNQETGCRAESKNQCALHALECQFRETSRSQRIGKRKFLNSFT
jgi:hypothetical protein